MEGSYNHLRAFSSQWEAQTGTPYQPQYLDAKAYQTIIGGAGNGKSGNGSGGGSGGGRGNGGRGNRP
ncbi:MAG: DUF2202 domain-containing protein [Chloroflexales bacterium]|nr:DUF2202 domain-containing protein [Chloroflexales bacterium]